MTPALRGASLSGSAVLDEQANDPVIIGRRAVSVPSKAKGRPAVSVSHREVCTAFQENLHHFQPIVQDGSHQGRPAAGVLSIDGCAVVQQCFDYLRRTVLPCINERRGAISFYVIDLCAPFEQQIGRLGPATPYCTKEGWRLPVTEIHCSSLVQEGPYHPRVPVRSSVHKRSHAAVVDPVDIDPCIQKKHCKACIVMPYQCT